MHTTVVESPGAPSLEALQAQHQQLRQQLLLAIFERTVTYSLGTGWSTVLVPKPSMTPMRLDRGFGQPVLKALYLNHPNEDADEAVNIVIDVRAEPDGSGAYSLDTERDNTRFSTTALLNLLEVLESGELAVEKSSCTRY